MAESKETMGSLRSFPLGSSLYSCIPEFLVSFLQSDFSRYPFHCLKDEGDEIIQGNPQ